MPPVPTIYLLYGSDEVSLSEHVRDRLISKMGDAAEMNITRFEGKGASVAAIQGACLTMPFLAPRRLVLVSDLLKPLTEQKGGKREAEELVEFFPQIPPTTALVFVEHADAPKSSPVVKWAETAGEAAFVKSFPMPKKDGLRAWIQKRAKAHSGEFTPRGAEALASAVGENPRLLDSEIEKLLTYVNRERAVDAPDVARLTPYTGEADMFGFVDAVGMGQTPQALNELHRLLEGKDRVEGYLTVFGMIVRQFRLLLQTRELMDGGARENEVATRLGLHPFPAGKVYRQAQKFSLPALEAIYRKLLAVDEGFKGGRVEGVVALDTLVVELARGI